MWFLSMCAAERRWHGPSFGSRFRNLSAKMNMDTILNLGTTLCYFQHTVHNKPAVNVLQGNKHTRCEHRLFYDTRVVIRAAVGSSGETTCSLRLADLQTSGIWLCSPAPKHQRRCYLNKTRSEVSAKARGSG